MEVKKCKTCMYWEKRDYGGGKVVNECLVIDSGYYDEDVGPSGFMYYLEVLDDSGLEFGIITGPEFGCLKWKAKEGDK